MTKKRVCHILLNFRWVLYTEVELLIYLINNLFKYQQIYTNKLLSILRNSMYLLYNSVHVVICEIFVLDRIFSYILIVICHHWVIDWFVHEPPQLVLNLKNIVRCRTDTSFVHKYNWINIIQCTCNKYCGSKTCP